MGYIRYGIPIPEDSSPPRSKLLFPYGVALLDSQGQFTLMGLVPGENYSLMYTPRGEFGLHNRIPVANFTPNAAGEIRLGDIVDNSHVAATLPTRLGGDEQLRSLKRQQLSEKIAAGTGQDILIRRSAESNPADINLPDEFISTLFDIQGAKSTSPKRILIDFVDFKDDGPKAVMVSGWVPSQPMRRLKIQPGGNDLARNQDHAVLLGSEAANQLRKRVGDKVELYGENFRIVGIYDSPVAEENKGLVVMLKDLQRLTGQFDEVTAFAIVAENPNDEQGLEELRQRLEALQPSLEAVIVHHLAASSATGSKPAAPN